MKWAHFEKKPEFLKKNGVRDKGILEHRHARHLGSNVEHQFLAVVCREISELTCSM